MTKVNRNKVAPQQEKKTPSDYGKLEDVMKKKGQKVYKKKEVSVKGGSEGSIGV